MKLPILRSIIHASRGSVRTAALMFLFGSLYASAQDAPIIKTHVTEVGGFVGGTFRVDHTRVMGGGNIVYSLTRVIMPFAEVSYFPGIEQRSAGSQPGSYVLYKVPFTAFNAGLHVRVPIPRSRIIPYGLIAAGALHEGANTSTNVDPTGFALSAHNPSRLLYATSFGGGLRYYVNERLGFRGEVEGYVPVVGATSVKIGTFYRVAAGFFFQF